MKVVAQTKWFSVLDANGQDEVIACADEVLVVAVDDADRILFIEEPVFAFGGTQLFFPGGAMKDGEAVFDVAQRELREETGFGASDLRYVGKLRAWPKYLRVSSHLVLARTLYDAPLPADERHALVLHRKTLVELRALIASGEMMDARIIAALGLCFPSATSAASA